MTYTWQCQHTRYQVPSPQWKPQKKIGLEQYLVASSVDLLSAHQIAVSPIGHGTRCPGLDNDTPSRQVNTAGNISSENQEAYLRGGF